MFRYVNFKMSKMRQTNTRRASDYLNLGRFCRITGLTVVKLKVQYLYEILCSLLLAVYQLFHVSNPGTR